MITTTCRSVRIDTKNLILDYAHYTTEFDEEEDIKTFIEVCSKQSKRISIDALIG